MAKRRTRRITALLALVLPWTVGACGGQCTTPAGWLDEDGAIVQPLGWLGGRAHPASRGVEVPDPDGASRDVMAGGMVVTEVLPGGELSAAGVARGDVIVRVGDEWLPNKEDPGPDLMRAIEARVSAGEGSIGLGLWRAGKLEVATLAHDEVPLEVGLPGPSERLDGMARAGLERLVALQREDGTFEGADDPEADVVTCSLAGLALLAGGARDAEGELAGALDRCRDRVEAAIGDSERTLDPWGTALATMFLAELAGPLEIEAVAFTTITGPEVGGGHVATGDFEIPEGAVMYELGSDELPPELAELLEGLDLPEGGGGIQISMASGPPPDGALSGTTAPEEETGEAEPVVGPLWSLAELGALAGEDLSARLASVSTAVGRLVALQGETGGWDPVGEEVGFSDATLATNQALLALGMAERVGVPVDCEVLRRGLAFVREHTNDGHVFYVDAPGFDRRREAGRASGAAAALLALSCESTDAFLRELVDYSDQHGRTIPEGSAAVPLHVLNTAILRRQQGLGSWAVFFEEFRHVLVMLQEPDGTFAAWPGRGGSDRTIDTRLESPAARTALWSLVAGIQADLVPVLLATARNPLQTPMTSEGDRRSGFAGASGTPTSLEGADLQNVLDAADADLEEMLRQAVEATGDQDE